MWYNHTPQSYSIDICSILVSINYIPNRLSTIGHFTHELSIFINCSIKFRRPVTIAFTNRDFKSSLASCNEMLSVLSIQWWTCIVWTLCSAPQWSMYLEWSMPWEWTVYMCALQPDNLITRIMPMKGLNDHLGLSPTIVRNLHVKMKTPNTLSKMPCPTIYTYSKL